MQGVQQLKKAVESPNSVLKSKPLFIFISPPSLELLEQRLRGRGTETDDSLQKRLDTAKKEMEWGTQEGSVDTMIVNDEVEAAYQKLVKAIFG